MIKPLQGQVTVKTLGPFGGKISGLILKEGDDFSLQKGEVIEISSKTKYVEKGWLVVYPKYAGISLSKEEEKIILLQETDILMKLEEDN